MGSGCICGKKQLTRPGEICSVYSPERLGLTAGEEETIKNSENSIEGLANREWHYIGHSTPINIFH